MTTPQDDLDAAIPEDVQKLAAMITEWVDGGIRMGTDWRPGLANIIARRLSRTADRAGQVSVNVIFKADDHLRFVAALEALTPLAILDLPDAKPRRISDHYPITFRAIFTAREQLGLSVPDWRPE